MQMSTGALCPLCANTAAFQFEKFGYSYFGCPCGFVFLWPRPSEGELQQLYKKHGEEYWTSERMLNFAFSPTKSKREMRFVRRFASRGTLLDIGCSTGSFVKAAREGGFDAEGVDISAPAVQCGQRLGLPLYALDILRESTGKQYDIITLWATLEHLPDPVQHLLRARELLKAGGLLFVSVPNYSGISQRILGKWDRYVGSDHLNYFRPKILRRAVERAGLTFKGVTTFGFNPIVIVHDFKNRRTNNLTVEDMQIDQASTLRAKESPLLHIQRAAEVGLDGLSLGDALAICAQN
jgi:2-polyprenyl-3-methyl-5-hydroxy-6-metoxy-1,4-benzoquinol methylase